MPNHIHGIIEITKNTRITLGTDDEGTVGVRAKNWMTDVGAKNFSPLQSRPYAQSTSRTIGSILRGFKIGVTKWFERSVWQRNYYEHIIRSMEEYERITDYIINNPAKWHEDNFYR